TGMEQITFLPGTYYEPTVLRDGRILFSFWDAFHIDVPPFDKHETYLMTVNPDGTEERHCFGAGQYRLFNRERHSGVGLSQPRARDAAIYVTHPETREETLVVNIPGHDEFDAVPVLVERAKPRQLPTGRASAPLSPLGRGAGESAPLAPLGRGVGGEGLGQPH